MSLATSRVFRGCRALLAPAKSAAAATTKTAAAATKTAAAKSNATKTVPKPKTPKPVKPVGILKPSPVSPTLRNFLGVPEIARTDAVKKIWVYIKQNNLQNPANKKEIFCDAKLKDVFDGKEKVGFLEIGKLLSKHFPKAA